MREYRVFSARRPVLVDFDLVPAMAMVYYSNGSLPSCRGPLLAFLRVSSHVFVQNVVTDRLNVISIGNERAGTKWSVDENGANSREVGVLKFRWADVLELTKRRSASSC